MQMGKIFSLAELVSLTNVGVSVPVDGHEGVFSSVINKTSVTLIP